MGWDLCVGLLYEHRFAMLIISKICGNVLQDLWEFGQEKKSPRFVGISSKICGNVGEKKNPQDLWARFSSLYPRKKIHKICGRDFHKIF